MTASVRHALRARRFVVPAIACMLLAACGGHDAPATSQPTTAARPAIAPTPRAVLKDVLETSATHIIGISYPPGLAKYPGLAAQAQRYAEQARRQVLDAARQKPSTPAQGPYELSLEFKLKHESPQLVVLAVDGSAYTGGAHGMPLIQRWVWLPAQARMLTAAELFPKPESWQRIAADVRTQLRTALSQRMDADDVAPGERAAMLKSAGAMIDGGTEPGPDDFAVFEPVIDADGHIAAIRFVFPPYQVGPYAEGLQTVELPAARLVQEVAPQYRALFAATA